MPAVLLFSIAKEAKPFVRKALDAKSEVGDSRTFHLVESRAGPSEGQKFKRELKDDETFETEFIGASKQDCQKWALEKQSQDNLIEQDIIAIADTRSASDGIILMQFYSQEPCLEYGIISRKNDTWHDFRIDYRRAGEVFTSLQLGTFDIVHPIYFGLKEKLTDERGVFNVDKAQRLYAGKDPNVSFAQ